MYGFKYTGLVVLLLISMTHSHADAVENWNDQIIDTEINKCKTHAIQTSLSLYQTMFKGKLSDQEYAAFIQSISQEMTNNCSCMIQQISEDFTYLQYRNQPQQVNQMASSLGQPGAACAPNMDSVLNRMRISMGMPR